MDVTSVKRKYQAYSPWGPDEDGTINIWAWVPLNEVEAQDVVYRIDTHQFISSIGGGLGLFLGFSVFSGFVYFFELLESNFKTKLEVRPFELHRSMTSVA